MSGKMEQNSELTHEGKRDGFNTRWGFVLASVGGAVGLGNIWKFPYMTGQYGGASFLVCYLIFIVVLATPILLLEFTIGRKTGLSYTGALKKLFPGKRIYFLGILGVMVMVLVMSFYSGISGWMLAYLGKSILGSYAGFSAEQVAESFALFNNDWLQLFFWMFVILAITGYIVAKGIRAGIEKVSNVLLPLLFAMMIGLAVYVCFLPGASAGLEFYLKPVWSKITPVAMLAGANQAIFSLGVGCGNKVVFGSYLDKKKTLTSSTLMVSVGDTLSALLAGFIIFPAVFSFGIEPTAGPTLVFLTFPTIFAKMSGGMILASFFYLFLFFACITSTISLTEGIVSYVMEEIKWSRKKSTIATCCVIFFIGMFQMLSFGPLKDVMIFGRTIFGFTDYFTASILQPFGGLIMLILFGWLMKPEALLEEINTGAGIKIYKTFIYGIKYAAPLGMILVWLFLLGIL